MLFVDIDPALLAERVDQFVRWEVFIPTYRFDDRDRTEPTSVTRQSISMIPTAVGRSTPWRRASAFVFG